MGLLSTAKSVLGWMQKFLSFATLSLPTILHTFRKIWYNEGIKSKGECQKIGVLAVIVLWAMFAYNGLVQQKNWVQEAWAQIDVQLQRRNDLVPNLVETVKGYAKHEQETLTQVIAMRNQIANMGSDVSPQEKMEASNQLSGALKTIFALAESYPDLKANDSFLNLQEELTNTENKISYARQLYNSSVARYNISIQSIPTNIIAGFGGFTKEEMLETPVEARKVPEVKF